MYEVTVREGAPVITVIFRVAKAAGIELDTTSALFEISEHLRIRESPHTHSVSLPASTHGVSVPFHMPVLSFHLYMRPGPTSFHFSTYLCPSLSLPLPPPSSTSDRPLEEHELIRDVMTQWPQKNKPKLLLRKFQSKNMLWGASPPVSAPCNVLH